MYLRDYKGKLVFINEKKYPSERRLYIEIWKIKYNIDIAKNDDKEGVMKFISGEKIYI